MRIKKKLGRRGGGRNGRGGLVGKGEELIRNGSDEHPQKTTVFISDFAVICGAILPVNLSSVPGGGLRELPALVYTSP